MFIHDFPKSRPENQITIVENEPDAKSAASHTTHNPFLESRAMNMPINAETELSHQTIRARHLRTFNEELFMLNRKVFLQI
jgi:hypothetical protein